MRCAVSRTARCGYFGSMETLATEGAPRQSARALVLLVRGALAHAASLGITRVATDIPRDASGPLRAFARRMAGRIEDERGSIAGDLAEIRGFNLDHTDSQGNER